MWAFGAVMACDSGGDIGGESHFSCRSDSDCADHADTPYCVEGVCQASPGEAGAGPDGSQSSSDGGVSMDGAQPTDGAPPTADASGLWPLAIPPADTPTPDRIDDCAFEPSSGFAAIAEGQIGSIALTDSHVYFVVEVGSMCVVGRCLISFEVRRIPRCGGDAEVLDQGTAPAGMSLPPLTAAGAFVFQERTGSIVRFGATAETIASDSCFKGLSGNETALFARDTCNGDLVQIRHDSTEREVLASGLPPITDPYFRTLTAAGTAVVYFNDPEGISWWSLEEGRGGHLLATTDRIVGLDANHEAVIALVSPDIFSASVLRIPLDGAPAETLVPDASPSRLVVESGRAYFSSPFGIGAVRTDGSEAASIPILRTANIFDMYGDRIYWAHLGAPSSAGAQDGYMLTGRSQRSVTPGAAEPIAGAWQTRLGASNYEDVVNVAVSATGEAIVLVRADDATDFGLGTLNVQRSAGLVVAKLSATGAPSWSTIISPASNPPPTPLVPGCLAVTPASDVAVTVRVEPVYGGPPVLTRVSSSGSVSSERAGSEGYFWDVCAALSNGDLVVVNEPNPGEPARLTDIGLEVLRVDSANNDVWSSRLGQVGVDEQLTARDIAADPAGDGAVVATTLAGDVDLGDGLRSSDGVTSSLVVRIDDSGALSWSALVQGGDLTDIEMTADGGVVALGTTSFFVDVGGGRLWVEYPGEQYAFVLRYDAAGAPTWVRYLRGYVDDLALGAGDSFLLGSSSGPAELVPGGLTTDSTAWLAELDAAGTPVRSLGFSDAEDYGPIRIAGPAGQFILGRTVANRDVNGITDTDGVVMSWP